MAKVLITGANGFVGKRLILTLLNQGHHVYALCRIKGTKIFPDEKSNLHYIYGDLRNQHTLENFPKDLDVAYYLVHSMSEIVNRLGDTEKEVVTQFLKGVQGTGVKQIIYLGGIINDGTALSTHLKSRLSVEEALKMSGIPVTVLRASIIIGEGSASFEIVRDLCEKLPLMITPRWVHSLCQPIAISDVLFYLSNVLLNQQCFNKTFDIGGPEILSFKEMMMRYSQYRKLKRWIIDVPFLTPHLSSYWLVFITSVRFSLCTYLVESMKSNTLVQNDEIQQIIPHTCLGYNQALELTFQNIAQNEIVSSWMDSWELHGNDPNLENYLRVPSEGCLINQQTIPVKDSKEATIKRIWSIGGSKGYQAHDWAWRLRGWMDRMIGGIGLNRGRRDPEQLQEGDSVDFWRVILADKKKGHLILFAAMKMPGEAWLEFKLAEKDQHYFLAQTATFRPKGLFGRIYWYALGPIHFFLFKKMAKALAGEEIKN